MLDGLMAYVAVAAEYLAANQRVLNLILVFSTICLAMIAIAAYVRTRAVDDLPGQRAIDRRAANGYRPSEPRFPEIEPDRAPAVPIPPTLAGPSPGSSIDDNAHRLSRLEESFLQLNRDMMHIDEVTKDLREELGALNFRLTELRAETQSERVAAPTPIEPVVGTALELVRPARADLVEIGDYDHVMSALANTTKKVDELNAMVESQRRTLLAVGQVLAQLPDWRKFRSSIMDSLEDLVSAVESRPRRSG
jgi:hypothetical protein